MSDDQAVHRVRVHRVRALFVSPTPEPDVRPPGRCIIATAAQRCVAGFNTISLAQDGRTETVTCALTGSQKTHVPIATVATTYKSSEGTSYLLIIHDALFYGKEMDETLLNPFHLGKNGFSSQMSATSSFIKSDATGFTIPLDKGGFPTHQPTHKDVQTLPRIILTSEVPWNPGT